jgi:hypothetical protein
VQSRQAGERVLASVERFLKDTLRLTVNREKSAVDRPWNRKLDIAGRPGHTGALYALRL